MPIFGIENTYHLPAYRHQTYETDTVEQACLLAIEDDDWSGEKLDYDTAGKSYVSGAWHGADAAYRGATVPIPARFHATIQRKAEHFETLLGILKVLARVKDLEVPDLSFWHPSAHKLPSRRPSLPSAGGAIPNEARSSMNRYAHDGRRHSPACRHQKPLSIAAVLPAGIRCSSSPSKTPSIRPARSSPIIPNCGA